VLEDAVSSGCYRLTFGIESGSDRVLQQMSKGHSSADALKAIHACKRAGIETKAFFMLGYPGETKDDMDATTTFAIDSGLDWAYFYLVRAFPGTALFADLLRRGYPREELLEYVHWVPAMNRGLSEVERECRSFVESSGGFSVDSVLKYNVAHRRSINEYSTNEELVEVLASAYRRFYYRPAFVETLKARLKHI
jgi:coproporphyrinogen III oxidase-like Fe-S oxidoreductase